MNLEKGKLQGYVNDFLLFSICLTIIHKTKALDLVEKFLKTINHICTGSEGYDRRR